MSPKPKEELGKEELELENGEELPDREVMSILSTDPQLEVELPSEGPPDDRLDPPTTA